MTNTKNNFMWVWGIPNYSMLDVSRQLRELNVSHAIRKKGPHAPFRIDLGFTQPRKVAVTDHIRGVKANTINFVIASYGELAETNYPTITESNLRLGLQQALESTTAVVPKIKERCALSYVEMVSKPSLLNDIQAIIYKIQPYSLRKETNQVVMSYLTSRSSERSAIQYVKRNMKTEKLASLLVAARPLRDAVALTKSHSVDEVSALTGVDTFDLNYLLKSKK